MGDRSSLNSSIQSFSLKKLKKTQTNDRSAPSVANNTRDRSSSESSIQIPSGRPKLTTRVSGPISPTNRTNTTQPTPANDQATSPMGFRLPMQLPDRSTLRHVDVGHKIKTEEKSPPWVRNNTKVDGNKPELHPRTVSNETLRVPAVNSIRNLPKTPPSSPVNRDISPPPPPVPARGRQGSVVKIPVPQNPNVMLGTPTSPPVMQDTPTADYSHPQHSQHHQQVSPPPPPVPRRLPIGQPKPVHVIEAQAPSSPEVSRATRHANAPVEHSSAINTTVSPTQQPVVVHHVTVYSPPFSHDPMMRRLGYGQEKQEAPKTSAVTGPATMELPPNESRVYQVNWRVQPDYKPMQHTVPASRPLPQRKLSLEDMKVTQPSPSQSVSVRDRSATLPRFRAPVNTPQTIR
jgi:hypothetical protein